MVIKLYSGERSNPLFPNDPWREAQVLKHLENHDIAPRLLDCFQTDAGFCLAYTHLKGRPWYRGGRQIAALLHRLHQIVPPSGLRRTADGSAALRRHGYAMLEACSGKQASELRGLEPGLDVPASGKACLLHADPVPANIICRETELKLIDWQCPAIGDPCEDIAVFLSPAMQIIYRGAALTKKERKAFLDAYPDRAAIRRYARLEPWYHWRMASYCLWKEAQGDARAAEAHAAETEALKTALSDQTQD